MKLPLNIDLKDKVAVVTGGGGILCAMFAQALAKCGAKVAILDLREEAANAAAEKIRNDGGEAIGVAANVLDIESLKAAHETVMAKYGPCDILLNGAGGNNPKGSTTKDYLEIADIHRKNGYDVEADQALGYAKEIKDKVKA